MAEAAWWGVVAASVVTLLGWGAAVLRAVASVRRAERALAAAREAGDERAVNVAEQRAADGRLRVARLTRWLRRGGGRRRAA